MGVKFIRNKLFYVKRPRRAGAVMNTGVAHFVLTLLTLCRCGSCLLDLTVVPKGHTALPVPLETAQHTIHINVTLRNV